MAWEWSHTQDAYAYARNQVDRLPKAQLLTILREWAYHDRERGHRLRFPGGQQVWQDARGKTRVRRTGEDCPVCDHDCPGAGCPVCDHDDTPAYPHGYPCDPADVVEQGTAFVGTCATCQQTIVVARIADVHGDLCETCATTTTRLLAHPEAMPGIDPFSFARVRVMVSPGSVSGRQSARLRGIGCRGWRGADSLPAHDSPSPEPYRRRTGRQVDKSQT